jgi:hypothetical protein
MAVYNDYTVEFYAANIPSPDWIELPHAIELQAFIGRQTATDSWETSTATITARFKDDFDTASLEVGVPVRFFMPGRSASAPSWTGRVRNFRFEYDMPYDSVSGIGNGDFIIVECEGALAQWGRSERSISGQTAGSITTRLGTLETAGYYSSTNIPSDGPPALSYATQAINVLTWLTNATNTGQVRILDGVAQTTGINDAEIYLSRQAYAPLAPVAFSDEDNDATNRIYEGITFDGAADNYYPVVTVLSEVVADETAGTDGNTLLVNTYSDTTANALSLATFLKNQFGAPTVGLSSITARTSGQHTQNLDTLGTTGLELGQLPAYRVAVTFRGTTVYGQIEGLQIDANLAETRYTYYLTPSGLAEWLTLNDPEFGKLDQNRLALA